MFTIDSFRTLASRRACVLSLVLASCEEGGEPRSHGEGGTEAPSSETGDSGSLPPPPGQPEDASSGGSLRLSAVRVSRTECVSPCPVMFSIDGVQDEASANPFAETGVYWDYGDPQADEERGTYTRGARASSGENGASRESDVNTPIGMHTYHCETGTCVFHPGVALRNAAGDWLTRWTTITVRSQAEAFPGPRTVCISTTGAWEGCPEGAERVDALPEEAAWQSDTRYLLRRGETFRAEEVCIPFDRHGIVLAAFGPADEARPEIDAEFALGCASNVTDEAAAAFDNPWWIDEVTFDGLRMPAIELRMTFRNVTFHDLDMDYEAEAAGGGIRTAATDACSGNERLRCDSVPLPYGFYLVGSRLIGSRTQPPGLNVSMLATPCPSFVGVLDSELRVAVEHNMRIECSSRVLAIHSDLNGDHIGPGGDGSGGNKTAFTLRPAGYLDADMLLEGVRRDSSFGPAEMYDSRYSVAKDLYLGTPDSINNSSRIQFSPTTAGSAETTRFAVVSENRTDMSGGSGDGAPVRDATLGGVKLVCYDDNRWQGPQGCGDSGQNSIPDGYYEPAVTALPPPQPPEPPSQY